MYDNVLYVGLVNTGLAGATPGSYGRIIIGINSDKVRMRPAVMPVAVTCLGRLDN